MGEPTIPTPKKREEFGPRKRAIFLDNLRKYGSVYFACKQAHIARSTAYDARNAEPEFAAAWEEAKEDGLDLLEATAHKRAHSSSDTLLIFLLKAGRPEKYRESSTLKLEGGVKLDIPTPQEVAQARRDVQAYKEERFGSSNDHQT